VTQPSCRLLQKLGFLMRSAVLTTAECGRIRAEMEIGGGLPATVAAGSTQNVDATTRRSQTRLVSDATRTCVLQRLRDLQPIVADHYHVRIADVERPQFLRYRPGDFFRPHADRGGRDGIGGTRAVSAVLFLNRQSEPDDRAALDDPGDFVGGTLTFHRVVTDPGFEALSLTVAAAPGLLVTFPSSVVHEVTPVIEGHRLTIVSWYSGS